LTNTPSADITVGTVVLTKADLETLRAKEWINDAVIMAYANVAAVEAKVEPFKNTARQLLLLDTRFAIKITPKGAYRMLATVRQFQEVCISWLRFRQLTFIGTQIGS
jgi:Ulp1 family protease